MPRFPGTIVEEDPKPRFGGTPVEPAPRFSGALAEDAQPDPQTPADAHQLSPPPRELDPMAGASNVQQAIASPEGQALAQDYPYKPEDNKPVVLNRVPDVDPMPPIDIADRLAQWAQVGGHEPPPRGGMGEMHATTLGDRIAGAIARRKRSVANLALGASEDGGMAGFAKVLDFFPSAYRGLKETFGVGDVPVLDAVAKTTGGIAKAEEAKLQAHIKELKDAGLVGQAGALSAVNSVNDTLTFLAGIKAIGLGYGGGAAEGVSTFDKVLGTLKHAQKIALFQALSQEGADWKQKLDTWKVSTLYMSTPAASGLLKSPAGVKALDLALNSLVSTFKGEGDYRHILNDKEMDGFDKTMALVDTLGADVVFSAMTKSLGAEARARAEIDRLNAVDAAVRDAMRPENAQMAKVGGDVLPNRPDVVAQAQGDQVPTPIMAGSANNREIANQIDAALAEEKRASDKQAKADMEQGMYGDPSAFDRWLEQVQAEEAHAQRERFDPQLPKNLRLMAQYIARSKGVGVKEAEGTVARLSYKAREQLLKSIRADSSPDLPKVAPETPESLARPIEVPGARRARENRISAAGKEYARRIREEQQAAQVEADKRLERDGIEQHVRELKKAGLGEQEARDIAEPLTPPEQQRLDWLRKNEYNTYEALSRQHGDNLRAILRDAGYEPVITTYGERGKVVERKMIDGRQLSVTAKPKSNDTGEPISGNASEQTRPLPVAPGADGAGAAVAMNGTTAAAPPDRAAKTGGGWKLDESKPLDRQPPPYEGEGVAYAHREDGTLKNKDEYTDAEWGDYTHSVIQKKMSEGTYPTDPPQDLGGASRSAQAGGFVAVPDGGALKRVAVSTGRFVRRWFAPSRNMDSNTRAAQVVRDQAQEAARVEGYFARSDFKAARATLVREHGREAVQSALADVVYGDLSVPDFARRFGLPADHPAVDVLNRFNAAREKRTAALADMLEQTGNPSLAERVRGNEAYVSRFYLKYAMGKEFVPKPEDYQAALVEVRAGIEDMLDTMQKRAEKAAGRSFRGSVVDYLNTGNADALAGLSKSRRAEIEQLGRSFRKIAQVVDSVRDGAGGIEFERNVAALEDAARSTIEFYLGREGGSGGAVDTSNLKKRFLGEAFRKLYGEVRDPVYAAAATAENQARMLAHLTFFNRLAQEAEGKSWSGMPSEELGTMKRLDDDRKRYGLLAGKYVTPELFEAIHGEPARMGVTRIYKSTLGTMRMLKLVGLKTVARNYVTGLTGFALGSGDMFRPNYWSNFDRGNRLLAGIVRNDPAALAELRDLVEAGAFSFRGNTQMEEIQQLFSMDPRQKLGAGIQKLGELYSLIDLPTKAAAYYTNYDLAIARGLSPEDARKAAGDHVQRFYQNPAALPKAVMKVSRMPLSDYPGYFADSIRIRAHQAAHAVQSARAGDLLPALGLLLSTSLSAGLAYVMGDQGRELWRKARRKVAGRDKDVASDAELPRKQQLAVREFVPDYYRDAPLVMWKEKRKDGSIRMYYTVTGGNGAFPLEDMLLGALQGSDTPQQFMGRFGRSVVQSRLSPGMLPTALWKSVTGDDITGNFRTVGASDVWGVKRPGKDKIYAESAVRLVSDVYGGQFGYKLMQLSDVAAKKREGLEPVAGSYTPYQSYGQVLGSMVDPARTYEITPEEAARMVRNRIRQYEEGIGVAKRMAGAGMRSQTRFNAVSSEAKSEAAEGQAARAQYIEELGGVVQQAWVAFEGVVDSRILRAVVEDALPNASNLEMKMILSPTKSENVQPYRPEKRPTELQRIMGAN